MAAGSTGVVIAALIANAGITVLKFGGFLLTGSPAMLAETYHSISDTGNQVLLLVGIRGSKQLATRSHPFGHGKSQFFYAFLVSVLLFGAAGWKSLTHGISELRAGGHEIETGPAQFLGITIDLQAPVDPFYIVVAILFGAIVFETYALSKANAELQRQMEVYDWSGYRQAFSETSDITTLTAFTEDAVALLGLLAALVGISATRVTGNPAYDAAAAVIIGVLLMVFAVALAIENKRLIIGESLSADAERKLRTAVESHDSVVHLDDFRTMFIGTGKVLVTADVSFDPELVTGDIAEDINQIEQALIGIDDRVKLVYIEPEL